MNREPLKQRGRGVEEPRLEEVTPGATPDKPAKTTVALTTAFCLRRGATVIVRGLRTAADFHQEYQLAAMSEQLGIQTVWLPSRPQLAATSSTKATWSWA